MGKDATGGSMITIASGSSMRRRVNGLISLIATASTFVLLAEGLAASSSNQAQRDGLVASLTVTATDATVAWRLFRPLEKPPTDVWGTLNGRALGTPSYELFPAEGQSTAVIALVDVADPLRAQQIESMKRSMLVFALGKSKRDLLGFAVYGLSARLLAPDSDRPGAVADLLLGIPPLSEKSNLSGALIHSIRALERWPGERRAIYVFTDGHNDSKIDLQRVGDLAVASGVALNFILGSSERAVSTADLVQLAAKTGGQVVEEAQREVFLRAPFALLHAGGRVRFPLGGAVRFFWESGSEVNATLSDGATPLELAAPADVPLAGAGETIGYLVGVHPIATAVSGIAVAAFGIGLTTLTGFARRRSRNQTHLQARSGGPPPSIRVMLQNVEDGSAYPVRVGETRLGRGAANDIVLHDETVSRLHALLRSSVDGYAIENISDVNGTIVNGESIEAAPLGNGDLITLGNTTLRFVLVSNFMSAPSRK
jgi:Inner membrane component of T3SS, cytoplasmic domain